MRRLLMAAACAAPCFSGCWASTTHVEPVRDEHVRFDVGPPQPHLRTMALSFRENAQGMKLILLRQEMCAAREVRRSQDRVHTKVEASSRRWVPATVLGGMAAAYMLNHGLSDDGADGGAVLLGSAMLVGVAAAFVTIPPLAEREEARLGAVHERAVPAPARPCGQAPLSGARVAIRLGNETREGTTGADGSVYFQGVRKQQVRTVFVDGVALLPDQGSQEAPALR